MTLEDYKFFVNTIVEIANFVDEVDFTAFLDFHGEKLIEAKSVLPEEALKMMKTHHCYREFVNALCELRPLAQAWREACQEAEEMRIRELAEQRKTKTEEKING